MIAVRTSCSCTHLSNNFASYHREKKLVAIYGQLLGNLIKLERNNFAFHQSLLICTDILFCSVHLLLYQVFDIYVYQYICCASFLTFHIFTEYYNYGHPTSLAFYFQYFWCPNTVMYCLFINIFLVNSFSCLSTVVEITELMMRHGLRIEPNSAQPAKLIKKPSLEG